MKQCENCKELAVIVEEEICCNYCKIHLIKLDNGASIEVITMCVKWTAQTVTEYVTAKKDPILVLSSSCGKCSSPMKF